MSSRAEQISQYIESALKTPAMSSVAAANVVRDPLRAFDQSVGTSLSIDLGGEQAAEVITTDSVLRTLEVTLIATCKGATARVDVDALSLEAHNRLWAAGTMGGLIYDLADGPVERNTEALEKPVAQIARRYWIRYYTAEGVLT